MWLCASALWARHKRASAEIRCIQSQTEPPRGEKSPRPTPASFTRRLHFLREISIVSLWREGAGDEGFVEVNLPGGLNHGHVSNVIKNIFRHSFAGNGVKANW